MSTTRLPLKYTLALTFEGDDPLALCDAAKLNKSDFDPVRAVARTLQSTHEETGIQDEITLSGRLTPGVRFSVTAAVVRPAPALPQSGGCLGGCATLLSDRDVACVLTADAPPAEVVACPPNS